MIIFELKKYRTSHEFKTSAASKKNLYRYRVGYGHGKWVFLIAITELPYVEK
jgi:hypothetical protein